MNLNLPKHSANNAPQTLTDAHQVTIIGANGSGKSRFCNQIMNDYAPKAFRLSALRAFFPSDTANALPGSIDDIFNRYNHSTQLIEGHADTEYDRLNYIMLYDEFTNLMNFKAHKLMDENLDFPKTKLDTVIRVWQEIFPKNKVLRENGKLLFANDSGSDRYSQLKLSDGENAVLYYVGAVLYAMPGAVILVDDPETFIHRSITNILWNIIEELRPDCTFIYNTHDLDFASSRLFSHTIWVKAFDAENITWDYQIIEKGKELDDSLYLEILGTRKPVLFVEGDSIHSIDSRLYQLIFPEYTVKPLGSCNKVIETVRSFNSLEKLHHLDSWGIVDRDRRTNEEVRYLRNKKILVPNVAEVENILMLEGVIRAVARHNHKNEHDIVSKVKKAVLQMWSRELREQALQHVRHRVKHLVEIRIDMRFRNINALENHLSELIDEIKPRAMYEEICREFHIIEAELNYGKILQVFNQKTILSESNVAQLCGYKNKEEYIRGINNILKSNSKDADAIRKSIKACFGINDNQTPITN